MWTVAAGPPGPPSSTVPPATARRAWAWWHLARFLHALRDCASLAMNSERCACRKESRRRPIERSARQLARPGLNERQVQGVDRANNFMEQGALDRATARSVAGETIACGAALHQQQRPGFVGGDPLLLIDAGCSLSDTTTKRRHPPETVPINGAQRRATRPLMELVARARRRPIATGQGQGDGREVHGLPYPRCSVEGLVEPGSCWWRSGWLIEQGGLPPPLHAPHRPL